MKLILLIIKHIFRKPFKLILSILQISIALIILITSTGKISFIQYTNSPFKGIDLDNTFYITIGLYAGNLLMDRNKMEDVYDEIVQGIRSNNGVEYVFDPLHLFGYIKMTEENIQCKVITYPKTSFNYRPILKAGKWLDEIKAERDIYPAVIGSNLAQYYKIGDRFKIEINADEPARNRVVELEVCGILRNEDYILDCAGGGYGFTWNVLMGKYDNAILTYHMFDTVKDKGGLHVFLPEGVIVKLNSNLSDAERNETIQNLSTYGTLIGLDKIQYKSREVLDEKIKKYSINFIMLLIMGFMGVIGVSLLYSVEELSEYAIWYLCGSRWKNIYILNFMRTLIIVLISALLSYLALSSPYMQFNYLYNAIISVEQYLVSGAILLSILLISNSFVFISLRNHTPIDLLRRFQKE